MARMFGLLGRQLQTVSMMSPSQESFTCFDPISVEFKHFFKFASPPKQKSCFFSATRPYRLSKPVRTSRELLIFHSIIEGLVWSVVSGRCTESRAFRFLPRGLFLIFFPWSPSFYYPFLLAGVYSGGRFFFFKSYNSFPTATSFQYFFIFSSFYGESKFTFN